MYALGQISGNYVPFTSSTQMSTTAELDMYLQLPNDDIDSSPLSWWKNNNTKFSRLSTVAKK